MPSHPEVPWRFAGALALGLILGCAGVAPDSAEVAPPLVVDTEAEVEDTDGDGYIEDDCDPQDDSIHPDAPEVCNEADDDCDGDVDEDIGETYCADEDGDGFGDATVSERSCEAVSGYVTNCEDCQDGDSSAYPGAEERCGDREDNDCDGRVDNGC